MRRFGQLVYLVERSKKVVLAARAQQAQERRRQLAQQTSLPPSRAAQQSPFGQGPAAAARGRPSAGASADLFEGLSSWQRTAGLAPAGLAAQRWLQNVSAHRSLSIALCTSSSVTLPVWICHQMVGQKGRF
jgi:hypothetical protein